MSKNFIDNIKGIINNKIHIYHSHISNKVIGYAHSFCNERVRENKTKTTVLRLIFLGLIFFSTERIKSWCLEIKRYLHRGEIQQI